MLIKTWSAQVRVYVDRDQFFKTANTRDPFSFRKYEKAEVLVKKEWII